MTTISTTTGSSSQQAGATNTLQVSAKTGVTQTKDNPAVKVQISDKARQAMASPLEKSVMATSNLEKQATKLAERAVSKNISDGERQKLSSALQSMNGAIKGLGGKQVSIDRNQDSGTTATSATSATQTKPQTSARSSALATAAENTTRKNETAQAVINNLTKAYGSGTGTVSGRLNLVA